MVRGVVQPALDKMATEMTKAISTEVSRKFKEALKETKRFHDSDDMKIAQLTTTVTKMTKAIASLEQTVLTLMQAQQKSPEQHSAPGMEPASSEQVLKPKTQEELTMDMIEQLLLQGEYEQGIVTWLQAKELQDLMFENVVVRFNPHDIIPCLSVVVVLTTLISLPGVPAGT